MKQEPNRQDINSSQSYSKVLINQKNEFTINDSDDLKYLDISYFLYFSLKYKQIYIFHILKLISIIHIKKYMLTLVPFFTKQLLKYTTYSYTTPSPQRRNILITAALPYVNNTPHLGNIIGGVLSADVYARYSRMMNYNTFFVCGTDEYGTTTQVKALKQNMTQQQICNKFHAIHSQIYQWFNISFDHFGRTTHEMHAKISEDILMKINKNNAINQRQTPQFYCGNCQMNLADRYVKGQCSNCGAQAKGDQCDGCSKVFKEPTIQLNDPKCSICNNTPKIIQSKHLYLKLSQMNYKLQQWIQTQNYERIRNWSRNAQGVTKGWLKNKLQDRCISRDLKWGVKIPNQLIQNKVMYVWFQAPLGYISMTAMANKEWEKWWIPDKNTSVELNQFMGKDNIMFHSIMAPCTLMATGENWVRPHRIAATQYLMYEGGKFSKSRNYGVFGNDCIKTGVKSDVWRYCLLSNRPETYDSQFTWQYFASKNNKDLVNTLGNMCQRILKYTKSKLKGNYQVLKLQSIEDEKLSELDRQFIKNMSIQIQGYFDCLQKVELKMGSQKLIDMAAIFNKYLQDSQFWDKKHLETKRNQTVICLSLNILKFYALVMQPYLPVTSTKLKNMLEIQNQLYMDHKQHQQSHQQYFIKFALGHFNNNSINTIRTPQILFEQISEDQIKQLGRLYGSSNKKQ